TLESARAGLDQRKAALPELEELGTGEIEVEGTTWIASEYGYTQPGRPTVVQAARYAVLDRGGVATDVRANAGDCGAESADDEIETVRTIQDSLCVTLDRAHRIAAAPHPFRGRGRRHAMASRRRRSDPRAPPGERNGEFWSGSCPHRQVGVVVLGWCHHLGVRDEEAVRDCGVPLRGWGRVFTTTWRTP